MNPIIHTDDVSFAYPVFNENDHSSEDRAIKGVSIDIDAGKFIAIGGHNGSGKSTLAKCLNALLLPTEGVIYVAGMNTSDPEHLWEIRQTTGMIFQNPDNQLVATIVEEDVAFGPENLGLQRETIRKRVDDALEAVDMQQFAKHAPHMLSGGQKQRIAIAGIIAMRPKVIVFDESTAMLDPSGRQEVLSVAKQLNRKEGITIIWITHFMDEIVEADEVMIMDSGAVILSGTPQEIFSRSDELVALGLDVPPVVRLSNILRENGWKISDDVLTTQRFTEAVCQSLLKS